jgi:YidC/Oxa1 family membrane protein insertase
LKTYTNEKSTSYENRYSELYFEHMEKSDYLGLGTDEADIVNDVSYIAISKHFCLHFIDRRTIRKSGIIFK